MKTYDEVIAWMFQQLPFYQNKGNSAYRPGLQRIEKLLAHLGNPHQKLKIIHVAGTNGKGSTTHLMTSVLMESGFKVGMFISPHFTDYRERITINGIKISKQYIVDFIEENYSLLQSIGSSFFEMNVGLAFSYYSYHKTDYAVIEVGLGGRLDATNIVDPIISVITNIGLDHMEYLGATVQEIAFEKAGIIKPQVPVVIGEKNKLTDSIFEGIASQRIAPLFYAENFDVKDYSIDSIIGYQSKNTKTALGGLELLKSIEKIHLNYQQGIDNVVKNTSFKGRWQIISRHPTIVLDVAHNYDGFLSVLDQLSLENYQKLHLVMGFVTGRNHSVLMDLLPRDAFWYLSSPFVERGKPKNELIDDLPTGFLDYSYFDSVTLAFTHAQKLADREDLILVCGSTFVVAEVLEFLQNV